MGNKTSNIWDQYTLLTNNPKVIVNNTTHVKYLLKQIHSNSKQQSLVIYHRLIDKIRYHNKYSLMIYQVFITNHDMLCGEGYQINIIMEYPHSTLKQQFQLKKGLNVRFTEQELWKILYDISNCIIFYQKRGCILDNLTIMDIYYSDGFYKIIDPETQVIVGQHAGKDYIVARLANIIMQLALLEQPKILSSFTKYQINSFYSDLLSSTINKMVNNYLTIQGANKYSEGALNKDIDKSTQILNFDHTISSQSSLTSTKNHQNLLKSIDNKKIKYKTGNNHKNNHKNQQPNFNKKSIQIIQQLDDIGDSQGKVQSSLKYNIFKSQNQLITQLFHQPKHPSAQPKQPSKKQLIQQHSLTSITQSHPQQNAQFIQNKSQHNTNNIVHNNLFKQNLQTSDKESDKENKQQYTIKSNSHQNLEIQTILQGRKLGHRRFQTEQSDNGALNNYNGGNGTIIEITQSQQWVSSPEYKKAIQYSSRLKISNQNLIKSDSQNHYSSGESQNGYEYVIEQYQGGSRYEGYKKNNERNGTGKICYQDGGMYDGNWKNNKMNGFGKLYYQNGKLAYEGYWKNDSFHGKGKIINDRPTKQPNTGYDYTNFSNINQGWIYYEGEFNQDSRQGEGILKLSNGQVIHGKWKNNCLNGEGTFYKYNNEVITGIWQENILVSYI